MKAWLQQNHPEEFKQASMAKSFSQNLSRADDAPQQQMPKNQMQREPGVHPGLIGLAADIYGMMREAPAQALQSLRSLPSELYGVGKQALTDPLHPLGQVAGGIEQGLYESGNFIPAMANALRKRGIAGGDFLSKLFPSPSQVARDYGGTGQESVESMVAPTLNKMFPSPENVGRAWAGKPEVSRAQKGDALLRGAGAFLPMLETGGAAGVSKLKGRLGLMGAQGVGAEENPFSTALTGLGMEAIGPAYRGARHLGRELAETGRDLNEGRLAIKGASAQGRTKEEVMRQVSNLVQRLKNPLAMENLLATGGSPLGIPELQENLRQAGESRISLGRVIDKPTMARQYENVFRFYPFSGVEGHMEQTAGYVKNRANELMDRFGVENPDEVNVGDELSEGLVNTRNKIETQDGKNWNAIEERAENSGAEFGEDRFKRKANEWIDELNSNEKLLASMSQSFYDNLIKYAEDQPNQSYKKSNLLARYLSSESYKHHIAGNKLESKIMGELAKALEDDIQQGFKDSGDPELANMHEKAMDYRRKVYHPFFSPEVERFVKRGGDSDTLMDTFVKTGKGKDRANLLNMLMEGLPEEKKNLVPWAYYRQAMEDTASGQTLNPIKWATLHGKLGKNQKASLIRDPELLQQLDEFQRFVGRNKKPLESMMNLDTGQTWRDIIPHVAITGGISALTGHPASLASLASIPGVRYLSDKLTSPEMRQKVVKNIIEQKERQARREARRQQRRGEQ